MFQILILLNTSEEQYIKICALKLSLGILYICVFTLYRASSGKFSCSLFKLDTILQLLYTPALHIIICEDININFLMENEKKNQFVNLFLLYNLTSIISFPVRVQNTSATAIDNIFNDSSFI